MFLVQVCGKQLLERMALLFFAAGFVFLAVAQDLPKPQVSEARTIILPQNVVAGETATLAVLDFSGRLLPNVLVELSGGRKVTTDATGRASFLAPGEAGRLIARIPGHEVVASTGVVMEEDSATQRATGDATSERPANGLLVVSYPHFLAIHDRFTIEGKGFRGEADSNRVFLADQPCLVLASSPVSLAVLPGPHVPIGATKLRVSAAGQDSGEIPVSAVLLELSGPAESPDAGAQGKLILRVHGSTESLAVEVRNGSPGIVQLLHGNVQRLATSGGEENIAPVDLKFLAPGDYTVTAKLIPGDSGKPAVRN